MSTWNTMICRSDDIKAAVSMRQAAEFYGFKPNRSGFICCPFHSEKTPSLKIYPNDRGWYCYGCGCGGDVIDFVGKLMNLDFSDACKRINADFSLGFDFGGNAGKQDYSAARKARDKRRLEQIQKREFAKWQDKLTRTLCEIHRELYRAMQSGDTGNPLFFTALQAIDRVAFLLDELETDPQAFYQSYRKEVEEIRRNLTG